MVREALKARWIASGGLPQGLSGPGLEAAVAGYVAAAHKALAGVLAAMRGAEGRVPEAAQPAADTVLLLLLAETRAAAACEALAADRRAAGGCSDADAAAAAVAAVVVAAAERAIRLAF